MSLTAKKFDVPMVAGQPGTLLEHGRRGSHRTWKPGPIKGTPYSVGPRGNLIHTHPQFKGSKKNRIRFKKLLLAARDQTPPIGYYELQPQDKIIALDAILDVFSGKWKVTPYIGLTVQQLRDNFPTWPRAARRTPVSESSMPSILQQKLECDCGSLHCQVCQA